MKWFVSVICRLLSSPDSTPPQPTFCPPFFLCLHLTPPHLHTKTLFDLLVGKAKTITFLRFLLHLGECADACGPNLVRRAAQQHLLALHPFLEEAAVAGSTLTGVTLAQKLRSVVEDQENFAVVFPEELGATLLKDVEEVCVRRDASAGPPPMETFVAVWTRAVDARTAQLVPLLLPSPAEGAGKEEEVVVREDPRDVIEGQFGAVTPRSPRSPRSPRAVQEEEEEVAQAGEAERRHRAASLEESDLSILEARLRQPAMAMLLTHLEMAVLPTSVVLPGLVQ